MIYAFGVELHMPFKEALEQVNEVLKGEGLGVVSDVDVQAVMRSKLQEEMPAYRILGACAPQLAKRVMDADPEAGALLPCNVIVYEDGGASVVSAIDPILMLGVLGDDPGLHAVAVDAKARLTRAISSLGGSA